MNASWARLDEEALRAPHGSASSPRENRRSSDSFLRKILKSTWVLVNVLVLIAMPLIIWDMYKHDMETHYVAWFVAGVFVLLAVPITFYEVAQHLEHYHMPRLQRYVIRILWMVPIYAVDCWLALRFKEQTIYFDTIRECYEAYVIYNFYNYCTVYLQEFTTTGLESIVSRKPQQQHLGPLRFLLPEMPKMGEPFLRLCRHGIINYVVVRPIISAAEVICDANGVLGDGQILNPLVAFPYLTLVNNASQAWAMYCLILFYRATHEELAPIRPFAKFCTVKAVVFLSFWQGQSIMLLVKWGVIPVPENGNVAKGTKPDAADYDAADVATGMQEFLICVEMFFAAIAHAYAFPTSEYEKRSSHDDDDDDDDSYSYSSSSGLREGGLPTARDRIWYSVLAGFPSGVTARMHRPPSSFSPSMSGSRAASPIAASTTRTSPGRCLSKSKSSSDSSDAFAASSSIAHTARYVFRASLRSNAPCSALAEGLSFASIKTPLVSRSSLCTAIGSVAAPKPKPAPPPLPSRVTPLR